MAYSYLVLFLTYLFCTVVHAEDSCQKWFDRASLTKDDQCIVKCTALSVDMGTFDCPLKCDELCNKVPQKSALPFVYPKGLSKGDREMVAKYPVDSIKVYQAKQKADDLTLKIFKRTGLNDESDAFRHFVWAALISKELGAEKAHLFLNAHEEEAMQPQREKEMDVFNNNAGVSYMVQQLKAKKDIEIDQIEKTALEKLKSKQLQVLTPSNKKLPDGYYSK